MSAVLVLTPVIIGSWPAITAAAAGAAAAMGLTLNEAVKNANELETKVELERSVEVELSESNVLSEGIQTDQSITLTQGGVKLVVKRDARGRCSICATGIGKSKAELKQIAETFSQKMTQCFVYDKVVRELKGKEFQVIDEEITDDETIRIQVRRWMD